MSPSSLLGILILRVMNSLRIQIFPGQSLSMYSLQSISALTVFKLRCEQGPFLHTYLAEDDLQSSEFYSEYFTQMIQLWSSKRNKQVTFFTSVYGDLLEVIAQIYKNYGSDIYLCIYLLEYRTPAECDVWFEFASKRISKICIDMRKRSVDYQRY